LNSGAIGADSREESVILRPNERAADRVALILK
jgi:hypothetical protein